MAFGLRNRSARLLEDRAAALYAAAVRQARCPAFYSAFRIADSVTGRFEMVVLHTVLLVERLQQDGESGRQLGQFIFDTFCSDMDQSLRELGHGDMAVPKRMKEIGESFYGRLEAYRVGLREGESNLSRALARNVLPDQAADDKIAGLARYVVAAAEMLAAAPAERLMAGHAGFPDPTPFARAMP
jgi:cytochrome b pre-mRNA-processing protein 3